jgi:membrane protease YdiL (CAAX protease family)
MAIDVSDFPPPPPRGHPLIAWVVIIVTAAALAVLRVLFQPPADVKQSDALELQGRYLVGLANLPLPSNPGELYVQAQELDKGPPAQRLRFVALAGELKGPKEALQKLDDLQPSLDEKGDPEERETASVLRRLYHEVEPGEPPDSDVTEEERQQLRQRLGWFGDLALNPRHGPNPASRAAVVAPARRAVIAGMCFGLFGLGAGVVGFALLILFFILRRQMRSRFRIGSPYGGVYAETFAVWMVLFIGLSLGSAFLPASPSEELLAGLLALGSLAALAWPVVRGVPWRQVRRDIGWRWGDRPGLEPFFGILCYLAALPVVIFLMLLLVVALQLGQKYGPHDLFGPDGTPTHPIVNKVLHSGWWGWIQALFLASVVAPIMEETMFRGVLYRHLREATGRFGRWWSVILSALVVSFVFAALHPQGFLAVPVLMALAFGFTAAREWRGSLVPSMTVHALHNGVLMLMLILAVA